MYNNFTTDVIKNLYRTNILLIPTGKKIKRSIYGSDTTFLPTEKEIICYKNPKTSMSIVYLELTNDLGQSKLFENRLDKINHYLINDEFRASDIEWDLQEKGHGALFDLLLNMATKFEEIDSHLDNIQEDLYK